MEVRASARIVSILRAAAIGIAVIALGHDLLALLAQTAIWPGDFASYYVPARVVMSFPGANVYDYSALLRLNATYHYVSGTFYPYIYPPFALLFLRPLAVLPFAAASTLWALLAHACAIGAAWLLADAFGIIVRRQAEAEQGGTWTAHMDRLLSATALHVGRRSFPVVPFAVASSVLLLAWPSWDTYYWGQINFVILFLLLLAFHADLNGHAVLAGCAVGLAAGLKLTPLFFLVYFIVRGSWKASVTTVVALVVALGLPLLVFPAVDYQHLIVELRILDGMFVLGNHNEAFVATWPHLLALLGHGGASAQGIAETLGEVLAVLMALLTVAAVGVVSLRARRLRGSSDLELRGEPLTWLSFAVLLAAYVLVDPLVWSHYYVVAMPAAVMIATYPLLVAGAGDQLSPRLERLLAIAGCVGIALLAVELPFGADRGVQQTPDRWTLLLLDLRPLALALAWLAAMMVFLGPGILVVRRQRARGMVASGSDVPTQMLAASANEVDAPVSSSAAHSAHQG